jgi:predicted metal-binding protein
MGKSIQIEKVAWNDIAVFICSKCRTLFSQGNLVCENPSEDLKSYLKNELKEKKMLASCRVMTSSCLGLCENDRQAVSLCSTRGVTMTVSLHPENDKEKLWALISKNLSIS